MSTPLFIPLPGNGPIASELANAPGAQIGALETREFPDGATYLRFLSDVRGRSVILVCTLAQPNDRFLPLVLGAAAARDLGARRVGLVVPISPTCGRTSASILALPAVWNIRARFAK